MRYLAIIVLLTLVGCGRPPDARRSLAECKIQGMIHKISENYFLEPCMESKGYILDENQTSKYGPCKKLAAPWIEVECFRPN
jgi:hypothetical protein